MEASHTLQEQQEQQLDAFTRELIAALASGGESGRVLAEDRQEVDRLRQAAESGSLTGPILDLFSRLLALQAEKNVTLADLGLQAQDLVALAQRHQKIDEHMVSVGGRLTQALPIASDASARVVEYLENQETEAPSGVELWPELEANGQRIRLALGMSEADWCSYQGQIRHCIGSADQLAGLLDLTPDAVQSIARVTASFRMRLTPYYASLIRTGRGNDPILLQSVPTGEMVDNAGIEIPPVAADHSPARLIDQFYPRVLTIKATNMCAMYCTHCLRLAHIGKKDHVYSREAYGEALAYIRRNPRIRDVLVTGGDALVLPNSTLRWLLSELDSIDHVKLKRLGSRVPVTVPMRIDEELLDILEASNDRKPLRVVTQINTAQEITPLSREAFKAISKRVAAVLNQAVLLKGINDSRIKMWKLCETIQEAYVRPYYLFNCSYRNPQFKHFRVPLEVGRDIVESMYGNISGDAIPRYIATAGGKIPLHRSNVVSMEQGGEYRLRKPWNGQEVSYPDADLEVYGEDRFAFARYGN